MKSAEAFRSIGEVAALIGVAPHVLRYWETQFPMLKPMKRPDGRRYFRPPDVALAAGLVTLLREDGLTIRGARKILEADRGESVRARGTERLTRMIAEASAAAPAKPIPDNPRASSPVPVPPVSATPAMAPEPALWLDRLIALARMLRQTAPDQRRWQAARPVALRLGQAMIRIP